MRLIPSEKLLKFTIKASAIQIFPRTIRGVQGVLTGADIGVEQISQRAFGLRGARAQLLELQADLFLSRIREITFAGLHGQIPEILRDLLIIRRIHSTKNT